MYFYHGTYGCFLCSRLQLIVNSNGNSNNVSLFYEGNKNGPIIIEGDRNRFCKVVNNLLSNALKFTIKGSIRIIIERYNTSNKIIVKIKDMGIGIHPDMLPKLFTKFATKSDTGGTGLGLFISKSIIEKHGGRIWAENNNFNGNTGAAFAFSLPMDLNNNNNNRHDLNPINTHRC
jgi:signal transduction histidine kinase